MQTTANKQQLYLGTEQILRYLLNTDEKIDTLITCKGTEMQITTYDSDVYQALGSLTPEEKQESFPRTVKLLEVADIIPFRITSGTEKRILTSERIAQLRAIATKKGE